MNRMISEDEPAGLFWQYFGRAWGTLAALASMYRSRAWLAILPLGLLAFALLGLPLVAGIVGQYWPRPERLVNFYTGLAEQETRDFLAAEKQRTDAKAAPAAAPPVAEPAPETTDKPAEEVAASSAAAKSEGAAGDAASGTGAESDPVAKERPLGLEDIRTSVYGELLYRRLLQLQDDAPGVKMMLAMKLARQGELSQARELIGELAPAGGGGYPPGHNWLAIDLLSRDVPLSEEERKTLQVHLAEADKWEGTGPAVRAAYAQVLASSGEGSKAIEVLERAVKQDPSLRVMLTAVAANAGDQLTAADAGTRAEAELLKKVEANQATANDYLQLAQLMFIREDSKKCLEYVERGLALKPEQPQAFLRLGSNAFLVQFRQSVEAATEGSQWNLELLDAALKADPTNPALSSELARVIGFGVELPEEIDRKLKDYLASGKATALLHFMIAERGIRAGQLPDALTHLEIAHQLAPGSPVIMNNLAVVQMMVDNTQLERSLQLIDECLRIGGLDVEFVDSKGQILLLGGKPLEAIAPLEKVIELAPERNDTRTSLVEAYRKVGMEDMAKLQEEKLAALRKAVAEKNAAKKDD
jgi:tetratricopeptide (TPR) repeat protein